jgi:hypothetical protein
MRRLIWLDEWQFSETESWLADMAEKGWRVEKIGRFFATLIKANLPMSASGAR